MATVLKRSWCHKSWLNDRCLVNWTALGVTGRVHVIPFILKWYCLIFVTISCFQGNFLGGLFRHFTRLGFPPSPAGTQISPSSATRKTPTKGVAFTDAPEQKFYNLADVFVKQVLKWSNEIVLIQQQSRDWVRSIPEVDTRRSVAWSHPPKG